MAVMIGNYQILYYHVHYNESEVVFEGAAPAESRGKKTVCWPYVFMIGSETPKIRFFAVFC